MRNGEGGEREVDKVRKRGRRGEGGRERCMKEDVKGRV